jgi:hypothetical protein
VGEWIGEESARREKNVTGHETRPKVATAHWFGELIEEQRRRPAKQP